MGQEQGSSPRAGAGERSLGAGVATTDDDHVKLFRIIHLAPPQRQGRNHSRKGPPNEGGVLPPETMGGGEMWRDVPVLENVSRETFCAEPNPALFADAELAKNFSEQIVRRHLACNAA